MKILLFNDNPVVRKLVALSAQKTKDELSVAWSMDEIGESDYDLLIIDDAMYSDELFLSLKEAVTYKSTLLMATRGQPAPLGFDNVIHKPFLPTDLVDMFVQIEKKLMSAPSKESAPQPVETESENSYSINLEEKLPELSLGDDSLSLEDVDSFDLGDLEGEIDLSGDNLDWEEFDTLHEKTSQATILDQEEVQEVQNLLDDTESDDWSLEEGIETKPIEETLGALEKEPDEAVADNDSFEDMGLDELFEEVENGESDVEDVEVPAFEDKELLDDEEFRLEDQSTPEAEPSDEYHFDEVLTLGESSGDEPKTDGLDDILVDKEELGDLDLDMDNVLLDELELPEPEEDAMMNLEDIDPFDTLDEKALKRAIGEEVEEESEESEADSEEFLDEMKEKFEPINESTLAPTSCNDELKPSHAQGVEALQALLKALTNQEVAKSLKGLNISININFGNDA